jgi:hypothetical protein
MRSQGRCLHLFGQEAAGRPANNKPVLQHRGFLTAPEYARAIRTSAVLGASLAILAVLPGCGGSSQPQSEPPAAGTTTATAPATTSTGIDPLAGAGTSAVAAPATATDTALLERIAVGRHEGYDRIVFQFRGDGLPGYRVEYAEPPFAEDGSGNPISVDGKAFVVVRMEPASGFDLNTDEGQVVYKGPKRIDGSTAGTSVVQQLVRTGDFEAVLGWVIGLEEKVDFRVTTAGSPSRLIVDFRNH